MTIHLAVNDVDAVVARAVACGATIKMPVAEMFWGDGYRIVIDPFGHSWSVATQIRDMTAEEIMAPRIRRWPSPVRKRRRMPK